MKGATSTTPATPNNPTPTLYYFLSPVRRTVIREVETEPLFGSSPRACIFLLNKLRYISMYGVLCTIQAHTYMYVRMYGFLKNQKQKPLICFIGTRVGKSVSFGGARYVDVQYYFTPANMDSFVLVTGWASLCMGNTQAMVFILRTGLFDYY